MAVAQVWKSYLQKLEAEKKPVVLMTLEAFPPEIIENKMVLIKVGDDLKLGIPIQISEW